jgi:hypothetical protein
VDPLTIVIILALLATAAAMALGLFAMASGGANDRDFSERLMWTRIAFQALTFILLIVAVLIR